MLCSVGCRKLDPRCWTTRARLSQGTEDTSKTLTSQQGSGECLELEERDRVGWERREERKKEGRREEGGGEKGGEEEGGKEDGYSTMEEEGREGREGGEGRDRVG